MRQYLNLLQDVLDNGIRQSNRTGVDCFTVPGRMLTFNLASGFPAVTTKQLAFKAVKGELIGFLEGSRNAARFRKLGCNVWNQNANEDNVDSKGNVVMNPWLANPNRKGEDDLGRVYGVQWRKWQGKVTKAQPEFYGNWDGGLHGVVDIEHEEIDQVQRALDMVRLDPTSRRIIVSAWNPAELDQMALPPCHMMFQLIPNTATNRLHMVMYQRSCDLFLGIPFNIASYALLLHIYSNLGGYQVGTLTMMLADCHIYENHIEQVKEQLSRAPRELPSLELQKGNVRMSMDEYLEKLDVNAIQLRGYEPWPAIKASMAG